jgi:DNA-binding XRE family transcriptional regulator
MPPAKRQRGNYMRRKDAQAIKRARKRARLTQRELAYLARCSQATIYLLEKDGPTGLDTISDDLAIAICDRLHVDLEDLFEPRTVPSRPRVSNVRRKIGQAEATVGAVTVPVLGAVLIPLLLLLLAGVTGIGAR